MKLKTDYARFKHLRKPRERCKATGKMMYPLQRNAAGAMDHTEAKKPLGDKDREAHVYKCNACNHYHWGHYHK
jgi:hypothetical protein